MLKISTLLVLIFFLVPIFPSYIGTVTKKEGGVFLKKDNQNYKKLKLNDFLDNGDIVKTSSKGKVEITFIDSSKLILSNRTKMVIKNYSFKPDSNNRSVFLNLLDGKIKVWTAKLLKGKSKYQIKTSTALIGVRGTEFIVNKDEDITEIGVFSGKVLVKNENSSTVLKKNMYTTTDKTGVKEGIEFSDNLKNKLNSSFKFKKGKKVKNDDLYDGKILWIIIAVIAGIIFLVLSILVANSFKKRKKKIQDKGDKENSEKIETQLDKEKLDEKNDNNEIVKDENLDNKNVNNIEIDKTKNIDKNSTIKNIDRDVKVIKKFEIKEENEKVKIDDKMEIIEDKIYFKAKKYELTERDKEILDKMINQVFVNYSKVIIEGHTDQIGSERDNNTLSIKRVKSVLEYIKDRMDIELEGAAFGSQKPAVDIQKLKIELQTIKPYNKKRRQKINEEIQEGQNRSRRVEFKGKLKS